MKYCDACKVKVANPFRRCPLCYTTLRSIDNLPEEHSYPDYTTKAQRYSLIRRILLMTSLSAGSICLTINLLTGRKPFLWSGIVIVCILYMWAALYTALRKHVTLGFKILIQVVSLAALIVVIDQIIGHYDWAYDYVLPGLFFTGTLAITILVIIKRVNLREFVIYFLLIALMGFIPIILLAAGLVGVVWPSAASAVYAGLSLLSLFVFADRTTRTELKKRFHI